MNNLQNPSQLVRPIRPLAPRVSYQQPARQPLPAMPQAGLATADVIDQQLLPQAQRASMKIAAPVNANLARIAMADIARATRALAKAPPTAGAASRAAGRNLGSVSRAPVSTARVGTSQVKPRRNFSRPVSAPQAGSAPVSATTSAATPVATPVAKPVAAPVAQTAESAVPTAVPVAKPVAAQPRKVRRRRAQDTKAAPEQQTPSYWNRVYQPVRNNAAVGGAVGGFEGAMQDWQHFQETGDLSLANTLSGGAAGAGLGGALGLGAGSLKGRTGSIARSVAPLSLPVYSAGAMYSGAYDQKQYDLMAHANQLAEAAGQQPPYKLNPRPSGMPVRDLAVNLPGKLVDTASNLTGAAGEALSGGSMEKLLETEEGRKQLISRLAKLKEANPEAFEALLQDPEIRKLVGAGGGVGGFVSQLWEQFKGLPIEMRLGIIASLVGGGMAAFGGGGGGGGGNGSMGNLGLLLLLAGLGGTAYGAYNSGMLGQSADKAVPQEAPTANPQEAPAAAAGTGMDWNFPPVVDHFANDDIESYFNPAMAAPPNSAPPQL